MIDRSYLKTTKSGVDLYITISTEGFYIRKVGTDEIYESAIDAENTDVSYEEIAKGDFE